MTSTAFFILEISTTLIAVLIVSIVLFYKWSFTYWKKRGVSLFAEPSIPFGNLGVLMKQKTSIAEYVKEIYDESKSRKLDHVGLYFFASPIWVVIDTDLIRRVFTKDNQHFVNRAEYSNEKADPLTGHLFVLEDKRWKQTRQAMTHAFTSGKIKMVFKMMTDCSKKLEGIVDKAATNKEPVDIKDYISRSTMEFIALSAFGIEIDTINNPDDDFKKFGKRVFENTSYEAFKNLLSIVLPKKLLEAINFKVSKSDYEQFFMEIVKNVVENREKNNIVRNDFLQLLIQLKNDGEIKDDKDDEPKESKTEKLKMTLEQMTAQAFVFFAAGFETSATTTTFALLELSQNQDMQDKVRGEINSVLKKQGGNMTYEACGEMTYLEQVIKETLRKYPPLPVVTRRCTKEYTVPNSNIVIEKGTIVQIPINGVHNDAEFYPEPEKFNPDRFADKNNIPTHAYFPFGDGPRQCIGMRLGLIQTKVALITMLRNYRVTLNKEKMITPIQFETTSTDVTTVKGGVWLDVSRI